MGTRHPMLFHGAAELYEIRWARRLRVHARTPAEIWHQTSPLLSRNGIRSFLRKKIIAWERASVLGRTDVCSLCMNYLKLYRAQNTCSWRTRTLKLRIPCKRGETRKPCLVSVVPGLSCVAINCQKMEPTRRKNRPGAGDKGGGCRAGIRLYALAKVRMRSKPPHTVRGAQAPFLFRGLGCSRPIRYFPIAIRCPIVGVSRNRRVLKST